MECLEVEQAAKLPHSRTKTSTRTAVLLKPIDFFIKFYSSLSIIYYCMISPSFSPFIRKYPCIITNAGALCKGFKEIWGNRAGSPLPAEVLRD